MSSAEVGMRLDMGLTLVDGYLQKVDVATMAMSLEARCPIFDYHLVEWSMRLPVEFKTAPRPDEVPLEEGALPLSARGLGVPPQERFQCTRRPMAARSVAHLGGRAACMTSRSCRACRWRQSGCASCLRCTSAEHAMRIHCCGQP